MDAIADSTLGNPALAAEIDRVEVKGNLVMSRGRYLRKHFGSGGLQDVAARVDGEARSWLESPPPAYAWVQLRPLIEIDRAIVELPKRVETLQARCRH